MDTFSSWCRLDVGRWDIVRCRDIWSRFAILSEFPHIGPTYPRGALGPLREIVNRPYRVFYDVSDDSQTVTVLHIRHGARQEPEF